ncbi:MAG: 2-hydroxyacid dehydrogenase [Burkholderiales bacterium]
MATQPLQILLYGVLVYDLLDTLQDKLNMPATITRLKENAPPEVLAEHLANADVVIALHYEHMPPAPKLRLLQVPGAGLDRIKFDLVPQQATICNAYGHDVAGGEYVVLAMLAWCHEFVPAHESLKAGSWVMSGRTGAPLHEELYGKTVGILGLGPIGLAAARLAKAFGTTVLGCNRTQRDKPSFVDGLYPISGLHDFLARCDFVAVCIAQTPQTIGLINRDSFQHMKPNAAIINVARGLVIDEGALYEALRDRRIAGAIIDAWYNYPTPDNLHIPPSKHPFHELPNVLMTPHSSIWTRGMIARRWTQIANNIDAYASGKALCNVVREAVI